jgi:hypothetical protein
VNLLWCPGAGVTYNCVVRRTDAFMRLCVYEGGLFFATSLRLVPPPVVWWIFIFHPDHAMKWSLAITLRYCQWLGPSRSHVCKISPSLKPEAWGLKLCIINSLADGDSDSDSVYFIRDGCPTALEKKTSRSRSRCFFGWLNKDSLSMRRNKVLFLLKAFRDGITVMAMVMVMVTEMSKE